MRIPQFILQRLKSFFNPQSAICIPHSLKYFSLSQQWVLLGLALLILALFYFRFYDHPSPGPQLIVNEFVVEVSGEVRNPGVYLFENAPALSEAIEKAGGLREPARVSLPSIPGNLETGTLLTVSRNPLFSPGQAEKEERVKEAGGITQGELEIKISKMAADKLLVFSIPLDLNQVSMEDLCLVPGIGASIAKEIIDYRNKRRAFQSVEELKKVKGVGEKKWKMIKNVFVVTHPPGPDPPR